MSGIDQHVDVERLLTTDPARPDGVLVLEIDPRRRSAVLQLMSIRGRGFAASTGASNSETS